MGWPEDPHAEQSTTSWFGPYFHVSERNKQKRANETN